MTEDQTENDAFADDVKRYEDTQQALTASLEALDKRAGQPVDAEHAGLLLDALEATSELREFLIRDLGTTVANVQNLENGLTSLGEFVNTQRQTLNDLSATVAALADVLLTQGTVKPADLAQKKNEIIAGASAPEPDSKTN